MVPTRLASLANRAWRVAVTREEDARGPLSSALHREGFQPVPCTVMEQLPSEQAAALEFAAASLDTFDWIICSSRRAVSALSDLRTSSWPRAVRTAAVGAATAEALVAVGADPPPVLARAEGADALWAVLAQLEWTNRRVLVPTVRGGRRVLLEGLREAGALVTEIEAYRMAPRPVGHIRADWLSAAPDAAVIASPSTASALIEAVGHDALVALKAIVVIGPTTAAALAVDAVPSRLATRADFGAAASTLAALRDLASPPAW